MNKNIILIVVALSFTAVPGLWAAEEAPSKAEFLQLQEEIDNLHAELIRAGAAPLGYKNIRPALLIFLKSSDRVNRSGIVRDLDMSVAQRVAHLLREFKSRSSALHLMEDERTEFIRNKQAWIKEQEDQRRVAEQQSAQEQAAMRRSPEALEREYELQQQSREREAAARRRAAEKDYSSESFDGLRQSLEGREERIQEETRQAIAHAQGARKEERKAEELKLLLRGLPRGVQRLVSKGVVGSASDSWLDKDMPIEMSSFAGHVGAVGMRRDGKVIYIQPFNTDIVQEWDVETRTMLREYKTGPLLTIQISPNGDYMATVNLTENVVTIWRLKTGEQVRSWRIAGLITIAITGDSRYLVISKRESCTIFDIANGEEIGSFFLRDYVTGSNDWIDSFAISEDGTIIALGLGFVPSILVIDVQSKKLLRTLSAVGNQRALSLAMSADKTMLAAADMDGVVRIWNIDTETSVQTLRNHHERSGTVAISKDNSFIALGESWGSVLIFETQTGEVSHVLGVTMRRRPWFAISEDDRFIVTNDWDSHNCVPGTIRIWRPALSEMI